MWGVERGSIFMVGPGRQLASLVATPLQWSMCRDITPLVQSVNLIRAEKSITPISLNTFSLRQQGNHG